jgi:hypothetical protein
VGKSSENDMKFIDFNRSLTLISAAVINIMGGGAILYIILLLSTTDVNH